MPQLYYFHDPMCSWCWGYRPVSDKLFSNLPAEIYLVRVLGGLAPDSNEAMPEELLRAIPGYWRKIEKLLGTEFNFDFWINCQPRRSTYPACRAVIAASNQGLEVEMIDAIQRAYYLRAKNPSNYKTHITLAAELNLDQAQFASDLQSENTEVELQRQVAFTRASGARGFPSLALKDDQQMTHINVNYQDYQTTLNEIIALLAY